MAKISISDLSPAESEPADSVSYLVELNEDTKDARPLQAARSGLGAGLGTADFVDSVDDPIIGGLESGELDSDFDFSISTFVQPSTNRNRTSDGQRTYSVRMLQSPLAVRGYGSEYFFAGFQGPIMESVTSETADVNGRFDWVMETFDLMGI